MWRLNVLAGGLVLPALAGILGSKYSYTTVASALFRAASFLAKSPRITLLRFQVDHVTSTGEQRTSSLEYRVQTVPLEQPGEVGAGSGSQTMRSISVMSDDDSDSTGK